MCGLKIVLWAAGILCVLSVFAMFLPLSVWEPIAKAFDAEFELPDSPLFEYMGRVMLATYAGIGVFFIILALGPLNYGVMVPFSGLAAVVLGAVCAITGLAVGMPVVWFLGDTLSCAVLGILIIVFWRKAKQTSGPI